MNDSAADKVTNYETCLLPHYHVRSLWLGASSSPPILRHVSVRVQMLHVGALTVSLSRRKVWSTAGV